MSIQDTIMRRIRGKGRGWVFVPKDFLDLGSRAAVDKALSRLAGDGQIRRLGQGVYDYPTQHASFGPRTPPADAIAQAIARTTQSTIQKSGAQAANSLGLTTQVPAKSVYLTDGSTRPVDVGPYTLHFRRAAPRNLLAAGTPAGAVFQALRHIGHDAVDDAVVNKLRTALDSDVKDDLVDLRDRTPAWMRRVIDQIAADDARTTA